MGATRRSSGIADGTYTHGHHESVLRSHRWRTAENSAGYLLALLAPGQDVLDVGCGPGTITRDLGHRAAPGRVVGVDASKGVVARAAAELGPANVTYGVASAYALPFAERSFDVVHAHQVLQHLADPVAALREMYRVVRPGGLVAVRDADYAGFVWAPRDAVLERWMALYHDVTRRNGGEADAGRYLLRWARAAGFTDLRMTSSTWTFADPEARAWWGGLWADRVRYSELATQARAYGLAQPDDLAEMAEAFLRWAGSEDATFIVPHGEVIGVRPADERRPPGAPYSLPNS